MPPVKRVPLNTPQFFKADPNDPKRYQFQGTPATDEEIAEQQVRNTPDEKKFPGLRGLLETNPLSVVRQQKSLTDALLNEGSSKGIDEGSDDEDAGKKSSDDALASWLGNQGADEKTATWIHAADADDDDDNFNEQLTGLMSDKTVSKRQKKTVRDFLDFRKIEHDLQDEDFNE